ncbi:MAG TPA: LCP family protein [Candidatus Faecivivens stercoravium]|uniref:LCP family protein n=1 Tax=Candidatus Faecivivens stercoravium TaxID=2840803 RepID=A0A9D1DWF4_9FIRM|nr:LCP family protein [Candidatus Faecivivens stercoravium]
MAKDKHKVKPPIGRANGILLVVSILLIVGAVLVAGYTSIMNWTPLAEVEETVNSDGSTVQGSVATIDEDIKTPESEAGRVVNFLVAGIDYNTTDATAGVSRGKLTDVIMVVQIDLETGSVSALQIPRDTWVGTNVSATGKINAVYGLSGIDGLAEVIYDRLLIPIDHYVTVDMDGFIAIVDAIGGVTITIDETFTLEGVTFTPGTHTLSGIEAEKFVRERHSRSGGDIGRINAQRQFLAALFSEMKDLSASELTSLASVVMQNVTTDLSVGTALSLVQEILTMDTDNMSFYMLPGQTATAYNGQSIWSAHKDELAAILNEHFRPYSDKVPAENLPIEEVANTVDYYDDNSATVTDILEGNDGEEDNAA